MCYPIWRSTIQIHNEIFTFQDFSHSMVTSKESFRMLVELKKGLMSRTSRIFPTLSLQGKESNLIGILQDYLLGVNGGSHRFVYMNRELRKAFDWALSADNSSARIYAVCSFLGKNTREKKIRIFLYSYLGDQLNANFPMERLLHFCGILQDYGLFSLENFLQFTVAGGDFENVFHCN